jgi:hypothetical protein
LRQVEYVISRCPRDIIVSRCANEITQRLRLPESLRGRTECH